MKLNIILIVVLLSSLAYAANVTVIDKDKNIATVIDNNTSLIIDKFTANNHDLLTLSLDGKVKYTKMCLEFPVSVLTINVTSIKIDNLLFDSDLKSKEKKYDKKICYEGLSIEKENIKYKIVYKAIKKKDLTLKYNITLDDKINLDPYLIGELANSDYMLLYMKFDNNINNTRSMKATTLNLSSLRSQTSPNSTSSSGACTDLANAYDGSYLTYSYAVNPASPCIINYDYSKTVLDTGMTWQVKDEKGTVNLTIPDTCFDYSESTIYLRSASQSDCGSNYQQIIWFCYDGSWQTLRDNGGYDSTACPNAGRVYDNSAFFTNQSGYTAFLSQNVNTSFMSGGSISTTYNFSMNLVNETNTSFRFNSLNNEKINTSAINISGAMATSFCAWSKPEDASGSRSILMTGTLGAGTWRSMGIDSGKLYCIGGGADFTTSSMYFANNTWVHSCCIYNTSHWIGYINGVNVGSAAATLNTASNTPIIIGDISVGSYAFKGLIDELIVYNYALSANEINLLANGYDAALNLTIYDAENRNLISTPITVNLYNEVTNYSYSTTTSNGIVFINGIDIGSLRILAYGDDYDANTVFTTIATNTQNNVSIYLTNNTDTSVKDVLLHVKDEIGDNLEGALIKIYFQNGSSYLLSAEKYTSMSGSVLHQFVKDSVWYKITIYYNNEKCYETSKSFTINALDDNIYFRCRTSDNYIERRDSFNNITTTLSFTNTTNITALASMEGSSTNTSEFCLEIYQEYTLVNRTCQNSTSFLVTYLVNGTNLTRTTTFSAKALSRPQNETIWQSTTKFVRLEITSSWDLGAFGLLLGLIIMIVPTIALIRIPGLAAIWLGVSFAFNTYIKFIPLDFYTVGLPLCSVCLVVSFLTFKRGTP